MAIGAGKRKNPVVQSGISINIQFSSSDKRTIEMTWRTIQKSAGCVDLTGANGSIRVAKGARSFRDVTDPSVFRFPQHFARLKEGEIAIVKPEGATFWLLVQLLNVYENDILIQWECRND